QHMASQVSGTQRNAWLPGPTSRSGACGAIPAHFSRATAAQCWTRSICSDVWAAWEMGNLREIVYGVAHAIGLRV
ncbi:MAG TPA: hypothetical protein QGF05_07875, partial [Dehalococcoidia bacterium]|nr:hypothetical protein [Dehalococcoidia bacterium]